MPQGLRGWVARIGAGAVLCSGVVGCMTGTGNRTATLPPVSKAKAGQPTPPGAKTTTGATLPGNGMGFGTAGGFQLSTVPPGGGLPATANPNNTGAIGAPTVPGPAGVGAPMPGPVGLAPPAGGVAPAGYATPGGYPAPGAVTARSPGAPPVAPLTEFQQPAAPPAPIIPGPVPPAAPPYPPQ